MYSSLYFYQESKHWNLRLKQPITNICSPKSALRILGVHEDKFLVMSVHWGGDQLSFPADRCLSSLPFSAFYSSEVTGQSGGKWRRFLSEPCCSPQNQTGYLLVLGARLQPKVLNVDTAAKYADTTAKYADTAAKYADTAAKYEDIAVECVDKASKYVDMVVDM